MASCLRRLLPLIWIAGACSCAKLPEPQGLPILPGAVVPEFTGGPQTPEIAAKKAALVTEYQSLAEAEAELDRKRMSWMTTESGSVFGGHFGHSTMGFQKDLLAKTEKQVAFHEDRIERLQKELIHAGVVIKTHR